MSNNKKWYEQQTAIILLLIFFFPVGLYLMWKYTDWNKGLKTGISVLAGIIVISAMANPDSQQSNKTANNNENKQEVAKVESKPEQKPAEQPKPQAPASTIDQLWTAVDKGVGSRDGVEVKYSDQTKIAELIITKKSDDFWDSKAVIQSGYKNFVKWGQEVVKISGPETINITLKTDFKDAYGKTSTDNAVQIAMQTENFKKFDWKSLEAQPIASQLQSQQTNELGYLIVHPALRSELNNAKLFL